MSLKPGQEMSRKRQRTNDFRVKELSSEEDLTRDEIVWFQDGNIVVIAGPGCNGDGPIYGFKCHGGILASRSKVFETMLSSSTDSRSGLSADVTVDGIPTVPLPDPWEEVRDFLRMMYGSLPLPLERRSPLSPNMIGGPLKLAVKYEVTDMVAAFHAVIYRDWPNIYAEWLEVEEQIRTERKLICDAELEGVCPEYDVNCSTPNSGRLVRLVQDGHAGWALRAAWYELARSYGQGCIPFRNESPYNHEHVTRRTAKLSVLDANDLRRLVVGRERMVDMVGIVFDELCHHELFSALPAGTTPRNARYHQPCAEKSTQILQRYEKGELYLEMTRDPLEVFRRMQLEIDRAQAVCSSCRRSAMHALTEACQQIWDALDDIFDLKSLRRDLGSYED